MKPLDFVPPDSPHGLNSGAASPQNGMLDKFKFFKGDRSGEKATPTKGNAVNAFTGQPTDRPTNRPTNGRSDREYPSYKSSEESNYLIHLLFFIRTKFIRTLGFKLSKMLRILEGFISFKI